jgi:hypothetical protein
MPTIEEGLRQYYDDFAAERYSAITRRLAGRADYLTINDHHVTPPVMGRNDFVNGLRRWHAHFANLRIECLTLRAQPGRVRDRAHAVHCYLARYDLTGRYVVAIPGLEETAPVRGRGAMVRLPLTEFIWLDEAEKILRITSNFDESKLR